MSAKIVSCVDIGRIIPLLTLLRHQTSSGIKGKMLLEEMWRYCVTKYRFEINMLHTSLKFELKNQHKREM
jgi:hypothetical protein